MHRVRRAALILIVTSIVGCTGLAAAQTPATGVIYDVNFNAEALNAPPGVHAAAAPAPRNRISRLFDENGNGSINVVGSHGALTDTPLKFDALGPIDRNFIFFNLDDLPGGIAADSVFGFSGQVVVDSGAGTNTAVSLQFREPSATQFIQLALNFSNTGTVSVFHRSVGVVASGPFAFNTLINFEFRVYPAGDWYEVYVDGSLFSNGNYGAAAPRQIVVEVGSGTGGGNMTAAVDNLMITAAPPLPTVGVLYQADFNADAAGSPPARHLSGAPAPRFAPTNLAGSPTVQASHGPLLEQPVVLDSISGPDDSMHFVMSDFPGGLIADGLIIMEAEISVDSGAPGGALFLLFLDDAFQQALVLQFDAGGSVIVKEGAAQKSLTTLQFDTKIPIRVEINLAADTYVVFVDGTSIVSGPFDTPRNQIAQFTATVGPALSGLTAAIDNIFVSIEPAPPPGPNPVVYSVDFDADATGALPPTHPPFAPTPRPAVAAVGGDPIVVSAFGALVDQPLLFDGFDDVVQDFILLNFNDLPAGSPTTGLFVYTADILVASDPAPDVNDVMQINIQGAATQLSADFSNSGTVRVERVTGSLVETMATGTFPLDSRVRFRMEVDPALDSYKVILNGLLLSAGSYDAPEILRSFVHIQPTGMLAAIDNIEVSIGGTPTQFVECPANDAEVARIFADAGAAAEGSYLMAFNPATTDGGLEDFAGAALCAGPSFPGDGTDPTVGFVRECVPDQNDPDACFGPDGRDALGGQFHHRVSVSGSECAIHCFTIDGMRVCQEVCVPQ